MNLKSVLKQVKEYNSQGISCSLSYLALTNNTENLVKREVARYVGILKGIAEINADADITIKLQQLGIYLDQELCYKAAEEIVVEAETHKNFVWIDMYLPDTVDATITIFLELRKKYHNVGICLQAYLQRTEEDLHQILKEHYPLRLVKGFYKEYDFDRWNDVSENYESLLYFLLKHSDRPAIATHDLEIIEKAKKAVLELGKKEAEFQFFKKIIDKVAEDLVKEGYNVRVYIPLGDFWRFFLTEVKTFDLWQNFKRLMNFLFSRIINMWRKIWG